MVQWIKRFAGILGWMSFFIVLFAGIDPADPFDMSIALPALARAIISATLFWFAGFIIGDIMFKGVVEDVVEREMDDIEGGVLQRIHDIKRESAAATMQEHQAADESSGK
jgi:hypothetical protein